MGSATARDWTCRDWARHPAWRPCVVPPRGARYRAFLRRTRDGSRLRSEMRRDGALERRSRESILTACGERGGPMTRAAASQIEPSAAHSPPLFPQSQPSSQGSLRIIQISYGRIGARIKRTAGPALEVIEGIISFLKRCFGWDRCAWRSYESSRAYTWGSVIAANLVLLARHAIR
jgi:hypothetical protein